MLVREVFGWLRYCLQHDPVCLAAGIVVEEIGSAFLSLMDVNDGPRTLAIFKADRGYTPRIEIRFTGERPQVWWMSESSTGEHGSYLLSPYSSRFPGDTRSWTRTQFVSYLVDLARSKLVGDTVTFLSLIPNELAPAPNPGEGVVPSEEVFNGIGCDYPDANGVCANLEQAKLPFNFFMMLVNTAKRAKAKGTKTSADKIVNFVTKNGKNVQKNQVGIQLAKDAAYYLATKSNQFNALQLQDLVDWLKKADATNLNIEKPLCSEFQDPKVQPHIGNWAEKCKIDVKATVEEKIKAVVEANNTGKDLKPIVADGYYGEFGEQVEAALHADMIPLPYLALLEKADYRESVAPWSMIRRSILAYEVPKDNAAPVEDEVVSWLDHSHLITALYKSDDTMMKELLARKVKSFAERTIGNPNWVKEIYDEVVSYTSENDRAKALQTEFDMWLLQALSPSISASKLPLSPHAFNTGRADMARYNKVFGSWLHTLKKSAAERRVQSINNLSHALDHFYKQVAADWNKDVLEGYEPRMPSIKEIMGAATAGDKEKLFHVLVADVEDELGTKVPANIKTGLTDSPYFNSIYREIRFQSVKL